MGPGQDFIKSKERLSSLIYDARCKHSTPPAIDIDICPHLRCPRRGPELSTHQFAQGQINTEDLRGLCTNDTNQALRNLLFQVHGFTS